VRIVMCPAIFSRNRRLAGALQPIPERNLVCCLEILLPNPAANGTSPEAALGRGGASQGLAAPNRDAGLAQLVEQLICNQ
jgi:hypothetical protein